MKTPTHGRIKVRDGYVRECKGEKGVWKGRYDR